jgi:hypothetical protein
MKNSRYIWTQRGSLFRQRNGNKSGDYYYCFTLKDARILACGRSAREHDDACCCYPHYRVLIWDFILRSCSCPTSDQQRS